jgi:SnoaL-like domain
MAASARFSQREAAISSPGPRRQTAGEGRKTFLVLTMCLLVAAGVTVMNISMVLSKPDKVAPISRPSSMNEQLVRDFYSGINEVIRSGDPSVLNSIVTPEFAWCDPCFDQSPTREGFNRYLKHLHRTAPGARLEADAVVADFQNRVTARVRVFGLPLLAEPTFWGPVDMLRIAGGFITERHNGPDNIALIEPLLETRLDALPPDVTGMVMARLNFPVNSQLEELLSPGPVILVVQSGAIEVRMENDGRIVRGGVKTSTESSDATLHEGDAAIIPPVVRYELLPVGTQPAVALGVTLYYSDYVIDSSSRWDPGPTLAFAERGAVAVSSSLFPAVQILGADTMGAWPSGPVRVAIGRAILGPGARMFPPPSDSMLLAVETGSIDIVGAEGRTVVAGTGVAQPAESVSEIRNAGDGLAVLLILTVSPPAD